MLSDTGSCPSHMAGEGDSSTQTMAAQKHVMGLAVKVKERPSLPT